MAVHSSIVLTKACHWYDPIHKDGSPNFQILSEVDVLAARDLEAQLALRQRKSKEEGSRWACGHCGGFFSWGQTREKVRKHLMDM